jgi:DNA modification methylase
MNEIICGDALEKIAELPENYIDLVATSPPYADQRKNQYSSINEKDYPQWTVNWMEQCKRVLKPTGSVAIVIRPHLFKGEISDYILHTRLAVRAAGWYECEELIWIKPNSPPLGSGKRPRRAWESILWFSMNRNPYCDPKANGKESHRVGFLSNKGQGDYKFGASEPVTGIARCKDYFEVGTADVDRSKENTHPAQYPEKLAAWIIRLLSPPNGLVLDPFMGSGSTAVACKNEGRNYLGFDLNENYCEYARKRVAQTPCNLSINSPIVTVPLEIPSTNSDQSVGLEPCKD